MKQNEVGNETAESSIEAMEQVKSDAEDTEELKNDASSPEDTEIGRASCRERV